MTEINVNELSFEELLERKAGLEQVAKQLSGVGPIELGLSGLSAASAQKAINDHQMNIVLTQQRLQDVLNALGKHTTIVKEVDEEAILSTPVENHALRNILLIGGAFLLLS